MTEPILSYELKALLDNIKENMVQEFPINNITLNYLILAILDNTNCDGYNIFSKVMMQSTIQEFKEFMESIVLTDCTTDMNNGMTPTFSKEYDDLADIIAKNGKTVTSALLLDEIISKSSTVSKKLKSLGVNLDELHDVVVAYSNTPNHKDEIKPTKKGKKKNSKSALPAASNNIVSLARVIPEEMNSVESNCINLVRKASNGEYDNIIGLDRYIDDIFDVLGKYDRNTVAIVGPSGVGKTSLVHRLAKRLYDQDCPAAFKNKYVMEFTETINSIIIDDMNKSGKYIAFIDDVDRLFMNKESEANNTYILTELFKSVNTATIVCMNDNLYTKYIESKPLLARYIQKIVIEEPTDAELMNILQHATKNYASYNNVIFNDNAINESVRLAKKFISTEQAPKSVLNVLDMASSHVRMTTKDSQQLVKLRNRLHEIELKKNAIPNSGSAEDFDYKDQLIREEITLKNDINKLETEESETNIEVIAEDVKYAVSKMTGIPVTEMDTDERAKLKNLYDNLTQHVIGQDDAVNDICRAVKRQRVGLSNPNKPCTMLFVGSTGTGKTFLAKRLAHEIFGNESNIVRLDMSEYSEKTSVTKLYGASAGYIGYEEGGVLTEAIKKKPRCVLLLDEIEKANDDVFNVFLQVFDEGKLTDNKGTAVDFKNVIIIMTSNVGAKEVSDKAPQIGFGQRDEEVENKSIIMKSIKKKFKPEFINRIDNICYFNRLTDDNLITIIKNEIKKVNDKVVDLGYSLDDEIMTGKLVTDIFDSIKDESEYGARPILREIQKQLEDKLTDYLIDNTVENGFVFKYDDIY